MTRSDYAKCVKALEQVRALIRDSYSTTAEMTKDEAASKAYSLTLDIEWELDRITPPWED